MKHTKTTGLLENTKCTHRCRWFNSRRNAKSVLAFTRRHYL